eukprot:m.448283 g.448283  ORF g.448283 m.448283 type:complete len:75 (-) comp19637_c0_seq1:2480-2704(-)
MNVFAQCNHEVNMDLSASYSRKKVLRMILLLVMSATPIVSRIECIDKDGTPMSTARSPVLAAMIGPMVVPQGQS